MSTIVEMQVHMDCAGCENKIRKALQQLGGVDNIEIDMEMQKVTVTGSVEQKKVLKAVRKTGRTVELWPFPYNPDYRSFAQQYYSNTLRYCHTQYEHNLSPVDDGRDQNDYSYYYRTLNNEEPATSSSAFLYNYYKHGYLQGNENGYYQKSPYSAIVVEQASSLFSDDSTNACSIM